MKRRIASVEAERTEQVNKLQAQLNATVAERDTLKSAPRTEPSSSREQELTAQLEALQKEKAALEAQVAAFQATPAVATNSTLDAELTVKLVRHTELHYTYPYSQCLRRTLRKSATNFVLKKQVG